MKIKNAEIRQVHALFMAHSLNIVPKCFMSNFEINHLRDDQLVEAISNHAVAIASEMLLSWLEDNHIDLETDLIEEN